jgi:GNAT superfamily N-acetyltransferase
MEAMDIELSTSVRPEDVPTYLDLVHDASLPYDAFVYDDEAQARRVQKLMFEAGVGDWSPPRGRCAMHAGEMVGIISGAQASELKQVRLQASMTLARAGVLADKDLTQRMRQAAQALAQPQEDDYMNSVVAVVATRRGAGVGRAMLELSWQLARDSGARRIVGQTEADDPQLCAYYKKLGYYPIGEGRVSDEKTGRALHYLQLAFDL